MSAYFVSEKHIQYLIEGGLRLNKYREAWYSHGTKEESPRCMGRLTHDNASEVGQMLWQECWNSVHYRYPSDTNQDVSSEACPVYVHKPIIGEIDPMQVIKLAHSYDYQSCEHPGWYDSSARCFTEWLVRQAIYRMPEYDTAEWSV